MTLYLGNNLISGTQTLVGESRNIGQIIPSTLPLTDAGLHLLDGTLILGSGIYSSFVDYIAGLVTNYPNLFVTEADWQTAVSTYGVCGKFVYDSVNNTVRLPKITGIIEGTTDATALGDLVEAGLPNITGTFASITGGINPTGVFRVDSSTYGSYPTDSSHRKVISFNASRSSSIYGNSSTVQPQTIKAFYYIVIATSTKTDIQVDIDEVVTDLNGKADVDLSNCTKPHVVETYVNGTSWYRVYSDGWCEQGSTSSGSSGGGTNITVTFLKPYKDTNYTIVGVKNADDTGGVGLNLPVSKTTTYFSWSVAWNTALSRTLTWRACGYIN